MPLVHAAGPSDRQIAASVRIAPSKVHRYLHRATQAVGLAAGRRVG
jgi:hypothetical protein